MPVCALLFTDVVDSTLLVERWGDARAAAVWAEHDRAARELIAAHHGREIDRTDGFFLLFDEARDAARFALAYHVALGGLALLARVGLHVGEVTLRRNSPADVERGAKPIEVEGLAKPIGARLMALARGGQTLLSAGSRAALGAPPIDGAAIESHGHYRLKGLDAPIEVFELGERATAAFAPPPDAEKAYRVVAAGALWLPLREVRHNLPAERDEFVGRSAELRLFAQRLDAGARWLTVLGVGGTGKTRFVTRYGWAWLGDWPGGVHFCDLSNARSLDGTLSAVAVALGVPLGKADAAIQLGHAIAARGRCLLILDNFEQVVQHAAATLGCWLDRAAEARFVVTSRERLQLPGEEVFPVEPLPVATEAIELFEARARAQRPGFAVDPANRGAVAEVVRLLDGLPLAIELAAARIGVLSPPQLVERLRDRFQLLAGSRGHAARQATLRAAIDWSWDLLARWEQGAFAQCSVFEGGFTLEAAEAVLCLAAWPEAPSAIDAVQGLVDKSLLRAWVPVERSRYDLDEPYFGMYISVHEYAHEKLAGGIADAARRAEERHCAYFARFGTESALDTLRRHGGGRLRQSLAIELDNLVVACRRAMAHGDEEAAIATYCAAWEVLEHRGPFALGIALGEQVLAFDHSATAPRMAALATLARALRRAGRVNDAQDRLAQALSTGSELGLRRQQGRLLGHLGDLHRDQGRMDLAGEQLEDALQILRSAGDRAGEGVVRDYLGSLHKERGDLATARTHYEAAIAIHRDVGNRRTEGIAQGNLGLVHWEQGRLVDARTCYDEALVVHREMGNRLDTAIVLGNLGNLFFEQGRTTTACTYQDDALAIHREMGNRRGEGIVLGNLGNLHREDGRMDEARAHYEASLAVHREVGNRRSQGIVLSNLATLHHQQGRAEQARVSIEESLAIHRAMGNRLLQGTAQGCLGAMLAEQGRVDDAHETLRAGEALLRSSGDPLEIAKLLSVRGRVDLARGDRPAALAALAEAQAVAASLDAAPASDLGHEIGRLRSALGAGRSDPRNDAS